MTGLPLRHAARVVLVEQHGATLLLQGFDPQRPENGRWWYTPGGGLHPGESYEQAGRREVAEETGLHLSALGGPVLDRQSTFGFEGAVVRQHDRFFVAHVPHFEPVDTGWTALERRATAGLRWWTPGELATTAETVHPADLLDLICAALGPADGSQV